MRQQHYDDFDANTIADILLQIMHSYGEYRLVAVRHDGQRFGSWVRGNDRAHVKGFISKYYDFDLYLTRTGFLRCRQHIDHAIRPRVEYRLGGDHHRGSIVYEGAGDETISYRHVEQGRRRRATKRDVHSLVPVPRRLAR